jgi:hypothetical protein
MVKHALVTLGLLSLCADVAFAQSEPKVRYDLIKVILRNYVMHTYVHSYNPTTKERWTDEDVYKSRGVDLFHADSFSVTGGSQVFVLQDGSGPLHAMKKLSISYDHATRTIGSLSLTHFESPGWEVYAHDTLILNNINNVMPSAVGDTHYFNASKQYYYHNAGTTFHGGNPDPDKAYYTYSSYKTVRPTDSAWSMVIFWGEVLTDSSVANVTRSDPPEPVLFPNPASNDVNILNIRDQDLLEVTDMLGRRVRIEPFRYGGTMTSFSIAKIPSGIYTVHIGGFARKLIVK